MSTTAEEKATMSSERKAFAFLDLEMEWQAHCPACGALHSLDPDQADGTVSVICEVCSWHGYAESTPEERNLRMISKARYAAFLEAEKQS